MGADPESDRDPPLRLAWISLGCAKNLVDSETLLGRLGRAGFALTPDPSEADCIVVNTCGFVEDAKEESIEAILEAAASKRPGARLVVIGCMAQAYGAELEREMPEIDAVVGLDDYDRIEERLRSIVAGRLRPAPPPGGPARAPAPTDAGRLRLTPAAYAYLRISEGCEHRCTFCAIPAIRGRLRSKPFETLLEEARELVASGARELVLIGQDTGGYGRDRYGEPRLVPLLERLALESGARWLRVLYLHPARIDDALIDALAGLEAVVPYLDIPIQHIDDRILRRMGRRTPSARIRGAIDALRRRVPGIVLRTTVLVGFPGEDEDAFGRLGRFVEEARFERLGAFAYSREEGTPAVRMPGAPPKAIALQRRAAILRLQAPIQEAFERSRIGREAEVLVEGPDPDEPGAYLARSVAEAPEVDPLVRVTSGEPMDGFARVRLVGLAGCDLVAEGIEAGPGDGEGER